MAKDYYGVLGVAVDADVDHIKRQYRLLVRENHPDVAADKETAHARMQLILEAWNVLADPVERERYDRTLREGENYGGKAHKSASAPSQAEPPSEASTRSRAAQNFKNAQAGPRTQTNRTRLLTMVFEANLKFFQGHTEEAMEMCNQVVKADPNNAEAAALLGDIQKEMKRPDAALLWYERAARLQPENSLYKQKWEAMRQSVKDPNPPPSANSANVRPPSTRARPPIPPKTEPKVQPKAHEDMRDYGSIRDIRNSVRTHKAAEQAAADAAPPPPAPPAPEPRKSVFGKLGSLFRGDKKGD